MFRIPLLNLLLAVIAVGGAIAQEPARGLTPIDFIEINRLGSPSLSPDGDLLVYRRSQTVWSKNEIVNRYKTVRLSTGEVIPSPKPRNSSRSVSDVWWKPDSSGYIYLRRPKGASERQAYFFDIENASSKQLTNHAENLESVIWAPDGTGFYFFAEENLEVRNEGQIVANGWHISAFDEPSDREVWYFNLESENAAPIIEGDFSVRHAALSRNGTQLVYTRAPDQRLNSGHLREVFVRDLQTGTDTQWTSNSFAEFNVQLSPDESMISFIATVNEQGDPYYEDKVFIQKPGQNPQRLRGNMPIEVLDQEWDHSGTGLYILGNTGLRTALYRYDLASETLMAITTGDQVVSSWRYDPGADHHMAKIVRADSPGELYVMREAASGFEPVTSEYADWDEKFLLPKQEAVTWQGRRGVTIEGLVAYPIGYQPGTAYPLVTITHGGPRSSSQFGSWNTSRYVAVLAAQGYMVFLPNHRGGTGYGDRFMRDMYGGYFRNAHHDVMDGIDALIERGLADPDRLIKMGWSAGGHMVNRLITETDRFKAASSGAGAADWLSMHAESDVRHSRNFMFGGSPFDQHAPYRRYAEDSPLRNVWKVTTPTLFFAGENDVRVPPTQSMIMFRGVQQAGAPTKFYQAPGEPHNFRKPAHQLFKINTELAWFARFALGQEYAIGLPKDAYLEDDHEDDWTLDDVSSHPQDGVRD